MSQPGFSHVILTTPITLLQIWWIKIVLSSSAIAFKNCSRSKQKIVRLSLIFGRVISPIGFVIILSINGQLSVVSCYEQLLNQPIRAEDMRFVREVITMYPVIVFKSLKNKFYCYHMETESTEGTSIWAVGNNFLEGWSRAYSQEYFAKLHLNI